MAVGARALWERLPAVAAGAAMAESAPASIIAARCRSHKKKNSNASQVHWN
jgi:hypothetical protein